MKKLTTTILALTLCISLFAQQWNDDVGHLDSTYEQSFGNDELPQKKVDAFLVESQPRKFGASINAQLGWAAMHEYGFLKVDVGANYRRIELTATAMPGITSMNEYTMILAGMIGYKFTINHFFNITPRAGLATHWDNEHKISFIGGNRFAFGGDLGYRVANNLDFTASFIKLRTKRNPSGFLYGGEFISAGIKVYLPHRNI